MNKGLRNELSFVAGGVALGAFLLGRKNLARTAALCGLALRFVPVRQRGFRGDVAVITGGSRGLGLALAEEFLREGAKVALLARDQAELDRAVVKLAHFPQAQVLTVSCDVTHPDSLESALAFVATHFGHIDVLVNNAGAINVGPFASMTNEDFRAQMQIHFEAALHAAQAAIPYLEAKRRGLLINVSSIGGKIPVPHLAPHCASKFALAGLSETLAGELATAGISVLTVYPGLVRTGSTIQAVFKGDHEKEYAWFATAASFPGLSMPAASAAKKIVRAAKEGRTRIVLSVTAKLAVNAHNLFPETFAWAMRLIARVLPRNNSSARFTGAESTGLLKRHFWGRSILNTQEKSEAGWNQLEKSNADFNLGIKH